MSRQLDIDYITKLRFTISPNSNGKFSDDLNLEVSKDTHEVRLAPKFPDGRSYRRSQLNEIPDGFQRQLFLFPSHAKGHGIGGIQNIGTGRWLELDAATGRLKTAATFTGAPTQVFDCQQHFADNYEGTLIMDPSPGPVFVGPDGEAGAGVLSYVLGSDGKPLGRSSGEGGAVVFDVAVVPPAESNCEFEFNGFGGTVAKVPIDDSSPPVKAGQRRRPSLAVAGRR
ncbi:hypothetical protein DFJ73DRAFT_782531 [Zopfochytrium polystomum]|nr:hypothetical protein DFJ73DRAFT_782531 [Zopfochytrium polystomum]